MYTKYEIKIFVAILFALGSLAANSQPVEWKVADGGNGHFYEVVAAPEITWAAARDAAWAATPPASVPEFTGHLVTITSQVETVFLVDNFNTNNRYWLGGIQNPNTGGANDNWQWITGEIWDYTNWKPGEPNDSGGNEDALAFHDSGTEGDWNDAPAGHTGYGDGGYIIEYEDPNVSEVVSGLNAPIFNQANVPGSPNPLTAGYQEALASGTVTISCCRVLDTREGVGKGKGKGNSGFNATNFDIGVALDDIGTNPTCVDMPVVPLNTAVLTREHRGTLRSRGVPDNTATGNGPNDLREHDLGVCVIEANVISKGVVFSVEEARNVLGYSVDCEEEDVDHRPFTGGVTISVADLEVDAPDVTRWSAECDGSRSAKRYSDNVMVVNLRHESSQKKTKPYLTHLVNNVQKSIHNVRLEGCVDNSNGFLDDLKSLVQEAKKKSGKKKQSDHEDAIVALDDATMRALLIDPYDDMYGDPYAPGGPGSECPGNPKGLFVGRLMALKFAFCSELLQGGPDENAKAPGACAIDPDILDALPPLP